MSKISPACISKKAFKLKGIFPQDSSKNLCSSKLKLKDSVIMKIFLANLKKAKISLRQKDPNVEIIDTLVSVEREYVKNLVSIRSKKVPKKYFMSPDMNTPNEKKTKAYRRKKTSYGHLSHSRKNSSLRKFDSTCSSPKSEALSKIYF